MIVYFEHYKPKQYKNISFINGNINEKIPYKSYMNNGYDSCYVDCNQYKKEKCFIYYIRDFMENTYPCLLMDIRKKKLERILK